MVTSYLESLQEQYLEEKLDVEKELALLELELKENIEFTKLLEDHTDVSFASFSPREVNGHTKIQLKELKEKQVVIIDQISKKKEKRAEMIQKLDELGSVIKIAKSNDSLQKNQLDMEGNDYRLTLLETQENERQRISRELHDSTVQNLTSMIHKLELCSKLIDMDPIRCKLELTMMSKILRDIINDTRQMIYNLRPMSFDDIGLDITIERAIDKLKNEKACNIHFSVEGTSFPINPVIGITLLRIIQEACNNAIKYARASIISVKLFYNEDCVRIVIEDDGEGFDVEHLDVSNRNDNSGFGLSMMKERVYLLSGTMDIHSKMKEGTKITVQVPICKEDN